MPGRDGSRRMALRLGGVAAAMLALSFAAVPLYDLFCRVTGYGGTTAVAEAGAAPEVLDRTIEVRFDANTAPDVPWEFRPTTRRAEIRLGETGLVFYEAYNPTDEPIAAAASFNVTPFSAGGYLVKIACFCFERQLLAPGERVEMPVTFYVDPAILDDPEAEHVPSITLSYTMHRSDLPEGHAAAAPPATRTAEAATGLATQR